MKAIRQTLIGFATLIAAASVASAQRPSFEICHLEEKQTNRLYTTSPPFLMVTSIKSVHHNNRDDDPKHVLEVELTLSDAKQLSAGVAGGPADIWVLLRANTLSGFHARWDQQHQRLKLICRGREHLTWTEKQLRHML
jgi:hypothetical protein